MGFSSRKYVNTVTTVTAGLPVLIGPIDVSGFDRFCVTFQNSHTAIGFLDLQVRAAASVTDGTAADTAPNWVQVNTATLVQPSALGPTATIMTTAVESAFKYIQVCGRTSQTAGAGYLSVTVSGFTRGR
jgi:hypothetical protein